MVGHTGFLLTTRRLADGVAPPLRRRRPAKGVHGRGSRPRPEAGPNRSTGPSSQKTGSNDTQQCRFPRDLPKVGSETYGSRIGSAPRGGDAVSSTDRPSDDARRRQPRPAARPGPAGQRAARTRSTPCAARLTESPRHLRALEERVGDLQANLAAVTTQNERLVATLKEARDQIVTLKEEVDRLAQPPAGFGVFIAAQRRRHRRHLHRRPQAAGRREPRRRARRAACAARRSCSTRR